MSNLSDSDESMLDEIFGIDDDSGGIDLPAFAPASLQETETLRAALHLDELRPANAPTLREQVRSSVENYFELLEGEQAKDLYALVLAEGRGASSRRGNATNAGQPEQGGYRARTQSWYPSHQAKTVRAAVNRRPPAPSDINCYTAAALTDYLPATTKKPSYDLRHLCRHPPSLAQCFR